LSLRCKAHDYRVDSHGLSSDAQYDGFKAHLVIDRVGSKEHRVVLVGKGYGSLFTWFELKWGSLVLSEDDVGSVGPANDVDT
jgi:hypothetical protein